MKSSEHVLQPSGQGIQIFWGQYMKYPSLHWVHISIYSWSYSKQLSTISMGDTKFEQKKKIMRGIARNSRLFYWFLFIRIIDFLWFLYFFGLLIIISLWLKLATFHNRTTSSNLIRIICYITILTRLDKIIKVGGGISLSHKLEKYLPWLIIIIQDFSLKKTRGLMDLAEVQTFEE